MTRKTQTNRRGKYELQARQGEVLIYSHVGFKPVILVVEDVTKVLNFEMIPEANQLDEVLVTARTTEGKVVEYAKKTEAAFSSSVGTFDPKRAGYSVGYVDGETINVIDKHKLSYHSARLEPKDYEALCRVINQHPLYQSVSSSIAHGADGISCGFKCNAYRLLF